MPGTLIPCQGRVGEVKVDWVVSCNHWHKLQFSAEELKTGSVNIFDHLPELMSKDGGMVGLITGQNGIHTNLQKFTNGMCQTIIDKAPEGTLFIGMHLPNEGWFKDIQRATQRGHGKRDITGLCYKQIFSALIDKDPQDQPGHALAPYRPQAEE